MSSSQIWQYFSIKHKGDRYASCNLCTAYISRGAEPKNFGTSALRSHLFYKHKAESESLRFDESYTKKRKIESTASGSSKTIQDCFTKNQPLSKSDERHAAITRAIAEMLAVDQLPYSAVEGCGFRKLVSILEPR